MRLQPSRQIYRASDDTVRGLEGAAGVTRHHSAAGDTDVNR
jgi:hypothetical protein